MVLNCLDLKKMRPVKCSRFLWRSFSWDSFSGTFAEIWAKILRTPKNLPAPTPSFSYMRFIDETDIDCKLSVGKGSVNVLNTSKMKNVFLLRFCC